MPPRSRPMKPSSTITVLGPTTEDGSEELAHPASLRRGTAGRPDELGRVPAALDQLVPRGVQRRGDRRPDHFGAVVVDPADVSLVVAGDAGQTCRQHRCPGRQVLEQLDRKSTRLNSSHVANSYAVFCL